MYCEDELPEILDDLIDKENRCKENSMEVEKRKASSTKMSATREISIPLRDLASIADDDDEIQFLSSDVRKQINEVQEKTWKEEELIVLSDDSDADGGDERLRKRRKQVNYRQQILPKKEETCSIVDSDFDSDCEMVDVKDTYVGARGAKDKKIRKKLKKFFVSLKKRKRVNQQIHRSRCTRSTFRRDRYTDFPTDDLPSPDTASVAFSFQSSSTAPKYVDDCVLRTLCFVECSTAFAFNAAFLVKHCNTVYITMEDKGNKTLRATLFTAVASDTNRKLEEKLGAELSDGQSIYHRSPLSVAVIDDEEEGNFDLVPENIRSITKLTGVYNAKGEMIAVIV